LRAPIHLALSVPLSRIFFNIQRVGSPDEARRIAADIAKMPEISYSLKVLFFDCVLA
jgi:hypothetical protein